MILIFGYTPFIERVYIYDEEVVRVRKFLFFNKEKKISIKHIVKLQSYNGSNGDYNRFALFTNKKDKIAFYVSSDDKMRKLMKFLTEKGIHIDEQLKKYYQFYN